MKKISKILLYFISGLLLLLVVTYVGFSIYWRMQASQQESLLGEEAPTLTLDGISFRDLNKNGSLDTYEDHRADISSRIEDLLSQMTLEEKAGLLFITMTVVGQDGSAGDIPSIMNPMSLVMDGAPSMITTKQMNHFNVLQAPSAKEVLDWHNIIQKYAERTRLGIPVTIATDPRHNKMENIGAAIGTDFFSRWPSQLGLGAIGDSALIREFGDIARQEYLAVGFRLALHPMADIATEPRWARTNGTFGEDAHLSAKLTEAYVKGFQGDSLSSTSVACMTKHFSGGGPQEDGWDAHFASGPGQVYPGDNFDYHLIPFTEGALPAGTAQIMPYYGIPKGQTSEEVAFGFNKDIITGLLRDSLGYDGVVCTDWGIVSDAFVKPAAAWGVEHLSEIERVEKILDAGCDMFGGESRPELVVQLVNEGKISEERLDISVRRVLRDKFRLGLFDQPYLDPKGLDILRDPQFVSKGEEAQRKALVLLKNENTILPLSGSKKIFATGLDEEIVASFGEVVSSPKEADVIIQKLPPPFSPPIGDSFLERMFNQGRLDYPEEDKQKILKLMEVKPTITIIEMERPPVIPEINAASSAVIASFECAHDIIMELIYGKFSPTGKLPIEIPSSMKAVEAQFEDVPYDSKDPLYPFGHGLAY